MRAAGEGDLSSRAVICNIPQWLSSKESTCNAGDESLVPQWEELLEEEMATHFSILAWKIPWTEKPGGLQSKGLHSQTRLRDSAAAAHIKGMDWPKLSLPVWLQWTARRYSIRSKRKWDPGLRRRPRIHESRVCWKMTDYKDREASKMSNTFLKRKKM